jgi:hypothetical protein
MSRRVLDLADVYADRLGVESRDAVQAELVARLEHLSQHVLCGGMPPRGKSMPPTAEAATVYGDLWVLTGFLADARKAFTDEEEHR